MLDRVYRLDHKSFSDMHLMVQHLICHRLGENSLDLEAIKVVADVLQASDILKELG